MRSSQAVRGLLTAVSRAAFGLESDGVLTSPFADLILSGAAFLAVSEVAALKAGSAARSALPAEKVAGCGTDAATRAGTAAKAALCAGKAGADADGCGAAQLADAMVAKVWGPTLGFEISLKAAPATTSAAKPDTSQTALRGKASSAAGVEEDCMG